MNYNVNFIASACRRFSILHIAWCCFAVVKVLLKKVTYLLTHTRLTALCLGLPRWAGTTKVKPIWLLLEQEIVSGSGISWATCKSAPRSRQITTPVPHHSVFYRPDALPAAQPTASKHWRHSSDTVWEYCDVELKWCEGRCVYRGGESGSVEVDPADCEGRRDFSAAGSCSCQSDDPLITFRRRRRRVLFMRCVIYQCYQPEDAFWGLCVCLYSLHIIYSCSTACFLLQVI